VVAEADDGGGVHACVDPTSSSRADSDAPSSDPMSYMHSFKDIENELDQFHPCKTDFIFFFINIVSCHHQM
jgi:hypothetical protein